MAEKVNILIAVPAYRGVEAQCVGSIIAMVVELCRAGIRFSFTTQHLGDIEKARNLFASFALNEGYTHILMIDDDMVFAPSAILKLVRANRDVIACNCPLRHGEENKITFSAIYLENQAPDPDGTLRVKRIGAGILMISTKALSKLVSTNSLRVERHKNGASVYGFFDSIVRDDGSKVGEDYSFCDRWSACGGSIFAVVDEDIGHIGKMIHRGKLADFIPPPIKLA